MLAGRLGRNTPDDNAAEWPETCRLLPVPRSGESLCAGAGL
jgi:hypothetical protein